MTSGTFGALSVTVGFSTQNFLYFLQYLYLDHFLTHIYVNKFNSFIPFISKESEPPFMYSNCEQDLFWPYFIGEN